MKKRPTARAIRFRLDVEEEEELGEELEPAEPIATAEPEADGGAGPGPGRAPSDQLRCGAPARRAARP